MVNLSGSPCQPLHYDVSLNLLEILYRLESPVPGRSKRKDKMYLQITQWLLRAYLWVRLLPLCADAFLTQDRLK